MRHSAPFYRDYRFWLIQILNGIACIQVTSVPSRAESREALSKILESSLALKSFIFFYFIAIISSAIIFGLLSGISTFIIASAFLIPKLVSWNSLAYANVTLVRFAVISALSFVLAYLVSREKAARISMQKLNEKRKKIILEKDRFFKLATEAQENERRRISRDLHDDSLQLLAAVLLQLEGAINADNPENAIAQMLRAKETISQTSDAIRRYCEALRPMLPDKLGVVASVEWIGQELAKNSGIKVDFATEGESRPIRDEDGIHIFRVMQEAFHNIEKHSKATAVRVGWKYSEENLEISMTDNGIGMWNFGPAPARSLGIQGMYERMELVAGKLEIESQPGFGTKVWLQIPLTPLG